MAEHLRGPWYYCVLSSIDMGIDVKNGPGYRQIFSAALISGVGCAAFAFATFYVATSLGLYDNSGLMKSPNDPLQVASGWALMLGCYGLGLGVLLLYSKGFWTGSLIMLAPFAMPVLIGLVSGGLSSGLTLICTAIVVGLIARLSANFAARSTGAR